GRGACAYRVRRGKQPERRMRLDHAALIEERETAFEFEYTLDDEHHVGTSGLVLVKHQSTRTLQCPRQNAGLKLGDLPALTHDDRVLADEIHSADVAIEIHAHARPVETGSDLFDVAGLARAMTALHHHAAVVHE